MEPSSNNRCISLTSAGLSGSFSNKRTETPHADDLSHISLERLSFVEMEDEEVSVRAIANKSQLRHADLSNLENLLPNIVRQLLAGRICETKQKELYEDLSYIKNICASDSLAGWQYGPRTPCSVVMSRPFGDLVNFALNLIRPPVPKEVIDRPDFNTSCFALPVQVLSSSNFHKNTFPQAVCKKARAILRAGAKLYPGKFLYLLRTSTTSKGPEGISPFTLSCIRSVDDGKSDLKTAYHYKLAYNDKTGRWQLAQPIEAFYDLTSSRRLCSKHSQSYEKKSKRFPADQMARDSNGNLLNSFSSLEVLIEYIAADRGEFVKENIQGLGTEANQEIEFKIPGFDEDAPGVPFNSLILKAEVSTLFNFQDGAQMFGWPTVELPFVTGKDVALLEAMFQAIIDDSYDIITAENCAKLEYLANFLGMDTFLKEVNDFSLTHSPFFHKNMGPDSAKLAIASCKPGTFLFRPSRSPGKYTVTYKGDSGPKHCRLDITDHGIMFMWYRYSTISELIAKNGSKLINGLSAEDGPQDSSPTGE